MLQQARPGGKLGEAAAGGSLRGPFLAPVELQVRLVAQFRGFLMPMCSQSRCHYFLLARENNRQTFIQPELQGAGPPIHVLANLLQLRRLRLVSSDGGDAPSRPLAEAIADAFVQLCTTLSCASDLR